MFVVISLAKVLSISKNIDNITKNRLYKFQRPVSNTLDFIQTYVTTNTEKLIFAKNALLVNRIVTFNFIYFSKEKNHIAQKICTHTQKIIENKKITFLENVKKIKNISIKGGGSP